jgi:hypothetical protein
MIMSTRSRHRDARWTVKFTKAKSKENGSTPPVDLAIPVFGSEPHLDRLWLKSLEPEHAKYVS